MGRDYSSGKSRFIVNREHYKSAYNALDFVDDDDKPDEENLIDCLADFYLNCIHRTKLSLIFTIADGNSDGNFDWQIILNLTPYLEDGSYYELPLHDQDRILIGTIKKNKKGNQLVRDFYQLVINDKDQFSRGEFIETFDINLTKE